MTFLLLWWAASRPVQTCRVTLDVESTPASLSLTQLRHWRPTLPVSHTHTHRHTQTHTGLCMITASLLQTCNPDLMWNPVRPPQLPSCYASDLEEESLSALVVGGECVSVCVCVQRVFCVFMHVGETAHTQRMCTISFHAFRLLYVECVSWLCVCVCVCVCCGFPCVSARCVWDVTVLTSADPPPPLHTWPPGIKAPGEDRCAARSLPSSTWKHGNFTARSPRVLPGAGGDYQALFPPAEVTEGESPNKVCVSP